MQIVSADDVALSDILDAMLDAYSDYSAPMEMDLPMFERMMTQRGYDPALSMLAVEDGNIAAFWLTGIEAGARPGVADAVTVGTRVAHRRKGIGRALLTYWAEAHGLEAMATINILDTDQPSTGFFCSMGWENHVNQLVMTAAL